MVSFGTIPLYITQYIMKNDDKKERKKNMSRPGFKLATSQTIVALPRDHEYFLRLKFLLELFIYQIE